MTLHSVTRRLAPLILHAICAIAAPAFIAQSVANAQTLPPSVYNDFAQRACPAGPNCRLPFNIVPAGATLIVKLVTCRILPVTEDTDITLFATQIERAHFGTHVSDQTLGPAVRASNFAAVLFTLNSPALLKIPGPDQPRINLEWSTANVTSTNVKCSIAGDLLSTP